MLRGVNKRIIEINDTGSEYFDKAFFIVNENKSLNLDELEREARRITADYFGVLSYNSDSINKSKPHCGYLRYTDRKKNKIRIIFGAVSSALVILLSVLFSILH
ncbi:MAG: hypothetical protein J6S13_09520 [Clostridia bacterium]|nr:hypothetical protein [Clostridia bacterium]